MARKRMELGKEAEARIEALMQRGGTAEGISAALRAEGVQVSRATIQRRMAEVRGLVRPGKASTPPSRPVVTVSSPLPPSPEEIPDGASLSQLDGWIEQAEAAIDRAEADGNLPLLGQMLRVAASLAETRRKATPPAKADPNDSPDLVAMGKQVAERLHAMVEIVATGSE